MFNFSKGLNGSVKQFNSLEFSEFASGPLYAYVGAGLSMNAGLPSWTGASNAFVKYLHRYADDKAPVNLDPEEVLGSFIERAFTDKGSERKYTDGNVDDDTAFGRAAVINMVFRFREERDASIDNDSFSGRAPRAGRPPAMEDLYLHSLLWRIGVHGVLTPNYDVLLERAFEFFDHHKDVRIYRYDAAFLPYILSSPRFIVKLHGDVNDIRGMLLHPSNAWSNDGTLNGQYGDECAAVYKSMLSKGSMIYLGNGFRDRTFYELHSRWLDSPDQAKGQRVAILPEWEIEDIRDYWANDMCCGGEILEDILCLRVARPEDDSAVNRAWALQRATTELLGLVASFRPTAGVCAPRFDTATDIFEMLYPSGARARSRPLRLDSAQRPAK